MAKLVTIRLQRPHDGVLWGFRLQGGADYNQPLSIQRITPGSLASQYLTVGDILIMIDGKDSRNMCHFDACEIVKGAGNELEMVARKADSRYLCDENYAQQQKLEETFVNDRLRQDDEKRSQSSKDVRSSPFISGSSTPAGGVMSPQRSVLSPSRNTVISPQRLPFSPPRGNITSPLSPSRGDMNSPLKVDIASPSTGSIASPSRGELISPFSPTQKAPQPFISPEFPPCSYVQEGVKNDDQVRSIQTLPKTFSPIWSPPMAFSKPFSPISVNSEPNQALSTSSFRRFSSEFDSENLNNENKYESVEQSMQRRRDFLTQKSQSSKSIHVFRSLGSRYGQQSQISSNSKTSSSIKSRSSCSPQRVIPPLPKTVFPIEEPLKSHVTYSRSISCPGQNILSPERVISPLNRPTAPSNHDENVINDKQTILPLIQEEKKEVPVVLDYSEDNSSKIHSFHTDDHTQYAQEVNPDVLKEKLEKLQNDNNASSDGAQQLNPEYNNEDIDKLMLTPEDLRQRHLQMLIQEKVRLEELMMLAKRRQGALDAQREKYASDGSSTDSQEVKQTLKNNRRSEKKDVIAVENTNLLGTKQLEKSPSPAKNLKSVSPKTTAQREKDEESKLREQNRIRDEKIRKMQEKKFEQKLKRDIMKSSAEKSDLSSRPESMLKRIDNEELDVYKVNEAESMNKIEETHAYSKEENETTKGFETRYEKTMSPAVLDIIHEKNRLFEMFKRDQKKIDAIMDKRQIKIKNEDTQIDAIIDKRQIEIKNEDTQRKDVNDFLKKNQPLPNVKSNELSRETKETLSVQKCTSVYKKEINDQKFIKDNNYQSFCQSNNMNMINPEAHNIRIDHNKFAEEQLKLKKIQQHLQQRLKIRQPKDQMLPSGVNHDKKYTERSKETAYPVNKINSIIHTSNINENETLLQKAHQQHLDLLKEEEIWQQKQITQEQIRQEKILQEHLQKEQLRKQQQKEMQLKILEEQKQKITQQLKQQEKILENYFCKQQSQLIPHQMMFSNVLQSTLPDLEKNGQFQTSNQLLLNTMTFENQQHYQQSNSKNYHYEQLNQGENYQQHYHQEQHKEEENYQQHKPEVNHQHYYQHEYQQQPGQQENRIKTFPADYQQGNEDVSQHNWMLHEQYMPQYPQFQQEQQHEKQEAVKIFEGQQQYHHKNEQQQYLPENQQQQLIQQNLHIQEPVAERLPAQFQYNQPQVYQKQQDQPIMYGNEQKQNFQYEIIKQCEKQFYPEQKQQGKIQQDVEVQQQQEFQNDNTPEEYQQPLQILEFASADSKKFNQEGTFHKQDLDQHSFFPNQEEQLQQDMNPNQSQQTDEKTYDVVENNSNHSSISNYETQFHPKFVEGNLHDRSAETTLLLKSGKSLNVAEKILLEKVIREEERKLLEKKKKLEEKKKNEAMKRILKPLPRVPVTHGNTLKSKILPPKQNIIPMKIVERMTEKNERNEKAELMGEDLENEREEETRMEELRKLEEEKMREEAELYEEYKRHLEHKRKTQFIDSDDYTSGSEATADDRRKSTPKAIELEEKIDELNATSEEELFEAQEKSIRNLERQLRRQKQKEMNKLFGKNKNKIDPDSNGTENANQNRTSKEVLPRQYCSTGDLRNIRTRPITKFSPDPMEFGFRPIEKPFSKFSRSTGNLTINQGPSASSIAHVAGAEAGVVAGKNPARLTQSQMAMKSYINTGSLEDLQQVSRKPPLPAQAKLRTGMLRHVVSEENLRIRERPNEDLRRHTYAEGEDFIPISTEEESFKIEHMTELLNEYYAAYYAAYYQSFFSRIGQNK